MRSEVTNINTNQIKRMKMKRTLVSLLSLTALFSLLTLTSCQKEQMGNGTQFRATMEGCTDQSGKTVLDGTALNWVEGDQIAVYGTDGGSGIYTATPQSPATVAIFDNVSGETGDGPFRAFYPSTLTTDGANITLPVTQTYIAGSIDKFPMYAESANNQLAFKNLCGVLKLHLTKANTNISTIAITTNTEINGAFSVDFASGIPELDYVSDGTNTTVLACATAQAIDNGADFYIYLPADSYTGLQIEMNTNDGKYCAKTANTTINIIRSQYTLVSLGENDLNFVEPLPEGALSGLFSVSATQQVRFSQGNLQYQASTNTWRFGENQFDYIGYDNENISATYSGWVDLFGWGTGNNPTLHTDNPNNYSTFVDWGVNAISNGGNQSNLWRTLSSAEWDYLFNTRTNASTKYGVATIGDVVNNVFFEVSGIIILPDNWVFPAGNGLTFNEGMGGYYHNYYSLEQWEDLENAGAVFLPMAGVRWGTDVADANLAGGYWSSTPYGISDAHDVYFDFNELYTDDHDYYCRGFAVRLVCNYN